MFYSKMDTMRRLISRLYGAIVSLKDGDYLAGVFGYREPAQLKADVKMLKEFFDNGCKFKAPDRSWRC